MRTSRALAGLALAAFTLTACSGGTDDVTTADDAAEETMDDMDMEEAMDDGAMDGMDMDDMDMGSSDGPRAEEVESASLREGELTLLASAPAAFANATGTAYLALGDSTTLTVDVQGMEPGTAVVGHLHAEACANDGGPHFKFDPDGSDVPPNEVHIAATADDSGAFSVSVGNEMSADAAMSVVIHAADGDTTKALCADLAA